MPRKVLPKARRVARQLSAALGPGEYVLAKDFAVTLSAAYGKSSRSWYVLLSQLFIDGKPARKYMAGFVKGYAPCGHVAIMREKRS